jgi:hypothetical protein
MTMVMTHLTLQPGNNTAVALLQNDICRGVDKFFKEYSLAKSGNNWPKNIERVSESRKKNLTRLLIGFVFLLANPELYSHLASWQVVLAPLAYEYYLYVIL